MDSPGAPAIEVDDVSFRYGDRVALKRLSLAVNEAEVFALLGPNGGGKTTLFRILAALMRPLTGSVRILGHDVERDPVAAKRQLGLVFQNQSLDRRLTPEENLVHNGHLYGITGVALRKRIDYVLALVDLETRRDDKVETLSGGLRRRVELAKSLLHSPRALLLDEPSTGVDPGVRLDFWRYLVRLRDETGTTVLLTTHLLEEADKCDRIAILDRGTLVAEGPPARLKRELGGEVIQLETADPDFVIGKLANLWEVEATALANTVRFEHPEGSKLIPRIAEACGDSISALTVSRPTLEDVFIHATGHKWIDAA